MTEQEAERVTCLLPLTKGQLWICKRQVDSAVGVTSGDPRDWCRVGLFWQAFEHWDHWEDAVRSCRRAPGSPQLFGAAGGHRARRNCCNRIDERVWPET